MPGVRAGASSPILVASAAYFVRSDTFITFPEGSGIEALEPGQAHLLPQAIERMIGLEGAPLSDDEVAQAKIAQNSDREASKARSRVLASIPPPD
jgi:hypothetical protein